MRVPTKLRRHNTLMLIGAILLSPTSTYPLTTHQHSGTMRISYMEKEHNKFKDLDRICSNIMPHLGSNNNNSNSKQDREHKIKGRGYLIPLMGENKRLLNIHEQKFSKLAAFQANTNVFQANTNASLKNMETQIGQLVLAMQNQSKDAFPSDTRKNLKDWLAVTLRSGREL